MAALKTWLVVKNYRMWQNDNIYKKYESGYRIKSKKS